MSSVRVYKYDLSNGMAAQLSPMLVGTYIPAIWHTSVVAFGREFYFDGGIGISGDDTPGSTRFGRPKEIDDIGTTNKTEAAFRAWIRDTANAKFGPNDYHLLQRNCNHFSSDAIRFLFDDAKDIGDDVKGMIPRIMATPMGQMFMPMLQQFTNNSAGQSQQQQFQGLQNQFQHDRDLALQQQQQQNHHHVPHNNNNNNHSNAAVAASSKGNAKIDEEAWEKLVEETEAKPATASLSSFLWVEQILDAASSSSSRQEIFPSSSGTNNLELDEKLLHCLGFVKVTNSSMSSSWRFSGDNEVLETAKMLIGSMVGDLEMRWSRETTSANPNQ